VILADAGYAYLAEAPGHVRRVRELFIDALDKLLVSDYRRVLARHRRPVPLSTNRAA